MAPKQLLGVSMPRSGHNFLVRMLGALLHDDLFYCEWYSEADCCQAVPCSRRGASPVSLQKSHDFDLNVPKYLTDVVYLIQHRAPVPMALSAREFHAGAYGVAVASDRGEYAVWLGRHAEYYLAFCQRWLLDPPPNSVVVDYDDLASKPAETLTRVLARVDISAAGDAIDKAVTATIPQGGLHGERPYTPRSIEQSRYMDRELLAVYESILVDHLPHLTVGRLFEPVDEVGTVVRKVFEARRAWRGNELETALALVDSALETEPEIGLLLHERATMLLALGRFQQAQETLAKAIELPPAHPLILSELVTVCHMLGDIDGARDPAEALSALLESPPADRSTTEGATGAPSDTARLSLATSDDGPELDRASRPKPASHECFGGGLLEGHGSDPDQAAEPGIAEDTPRCRSESIELVGEGGGDVRPWEAGLQQKEAMIAELAATAEERLQLIQRLDAEAARTREALQDLSDRLHEKDVMIADLTAEAEERLQIIRQLNAEAARAGEMLHRLAAQPRPEVLQRLTAQLQQKDAMIAELAATAEERLRLIQRLDAEAACTRETLLRQLEEKQSRIVGREARIAQLERRTGGALQFIRNLLASTSALMP
jgi:tetratricopeptide (TPR) repeat protein